ncbi:hypothetical protein [Elizabethkingia sp. JS20170427COW]|uniref:hypothetical protein n=1 Tax=Elizabethkingia sp. JS20170427COW TaxID=2583851 RepID=UPI0011105ED8|nr:hypothetical protein [Elizabethkingia sp. JS20170427COW]QCX53807.1 hypothetical protein FGE20_08730 [Elizabethkingia sp. JS20170427COW]
MKTIKKVALALGIAATGLVSAQSSNMNNILKVGVSGGFAVPRENASGAVGVDVAYQHIVTPGVGLGLATGYTQYFGIHSNGNDNNDFGVIPAAALIRIYPQKTGFYFGTDIGYGFITGSGKVARNSAVERPNGGFYLQPEIGFHNKNWNFGIRYQKVFTEGKGEILDQKYNAGNIGATVAYNIPLGK